MVDTRRRRLLHHHLVQLHWLVGLCGDSADASAQGSASANASIITASGRVRQEFKVRYRAAVSTPPRLRLSKSERKCGNGTTPRRHDSHPAASRFVRATFFPNRLDVYFNWASLLEA